MKFLILATTLTAVPLLAFAQQPPQLSAEAKTFAVEHSLQVCQSDDANMSAQAYDIATQLQTAQKQIEMLKAKRDTAPVTNGAPLSEAPAKPN